MTENYYWDALATHEILVLLEDRAKTSHGTSMKNADYKIFSDKLFEKIGRRYQPSQLSSKYHRFRKTYNSWCALMQHLGFGWDHESQTPICPEEIWQEYIQQNKGAKEFVKKGLLDSQLYEVIFEKQHATGRFAQTSASLPAGYNVHIQDTVGVDIDDDEFEPDSNRTTGEKRSNTTRCSRYVDKKKKKKKVHEHPLSPVIGRLTDVIADKSMSASVRPRYSGQGSEENTSALDDPCSMDKCYDILINMQLEPKLVMKIVTG